MLARFVTATGVAAAMVAATAIGPAFAVSPAGSITYRNMSFESADLSCGSLVGHSATLSNEVSGLSRRREPGLELEVRQVAKIFRNGAYHAVASRSHTVIVDRHKTGGVYLWSFDTAGNHDADLTLHVHKAGTYETTISLRVSEQGQLLAVAKTTGGSCSVSG